MRCRMKKTYAHHKPSPAAVERIAEIRREFSRLHEHLEAGCPASRERSIALTELETAAMWAIKAVVLNDPGSVIDD
jgi:hypothetical protein